MQADDNITAPKAKKRKTEQPEEVGDEPEDVEGEAEDEVEGKDLEDDEEDAGEDEGDEDVSFYNTIARTRTSMLIFISRLRTPRRAEVPLLPPKRLRARTSRRRRASMRSRRPSKVTRVFMVGSTA